MTGLWLVIFLAAPLAFAIARIAIRLQQPPGLAALGGALICWQLIALAAGTAPLAIAMALLFAAASLLALTEWLQRITKMGRMIRGTLLALTGVLFGYAALLPALSTFQALAFAATLSGVAAGAAVAIYKARAPIAAGSAGQGPLALLAAWLLIRALASFI